MWYFFCSTLSTESVDEDGESSLASVHMNSHASIQPFHEPSRHTHYGGQAQLPGHHSRVGEETAGREGGREGRREGGREGGREGEREGEREREGGREQVSSNLSIQSGDPLITLKNSLFVTQKSYKGVYAAREGPSQGQCVQSPGSPHPVPAGTERKDSTHYTGIVVLGWWAPGIQTTGILG